MKMRLYSHGNPFREMARNGWFSTCSHHPPFLWTGGNVMHDILGICNVIGL